jgi:arginine/lysine/ornithine decarboxylase
VQTTSPSYILMASLDLARMQMATEGEKLLDKAINLAEEARNRINKIPGLFCFGKEMVKDTLFAKMADLDVTKLTIAVSDLGLTGFQVSQILNNKYNIQVEMADPFHILVIVSIGDRKDDLLQLVEALREIANDSFQQGEKNLFQDIGYPVFGNKTAMTPREAFFADTQYVELEKAMETVSTEIVTVYPPGVPVLVPGEVISKEAVDYLQKMLKLGATVDGLDETNTLIGIVKR